MLKMTEHKASTTACMPSLPKVRTICSFSPIFTPIMKSKSSKQAYWIFDRFFSSISLSLPLLPSQAPAKMMAIYKSILTFAPPKSKAITLYPIRNLAPLQPQQPKIKRLKENSLSLFILVQQRGRGG
jgi:hypothetical protein